MKRILHLTVAAAAVLFAIATPLSADVGENFQKAGLQISGNVSGTLDMGYLLRALYPSSDVQNTSQTFTFTASPSVSVFVADNVAVGLGASATLGASRNFDFEGTVPVLWYSDRSLSANVSASLSLYPGGASASVGGLVPYVSLSGWVGATPGVKDYDPYGSVWADEVDRSLSVNFGISTRVGGYFFVAERIAIGGTIVLDVSNSRNILDRNGAAYPPSDLYNFWQRMYFRATPTFGISYFMPSADRVFPLGKK